MSAQFPSSFEESNPAKKQAIERWLLANVDDSQHKRRHVICYHNNTSFYMISLPSTMKWKPEFKMKLLSTITDHNMKEELVKSGVINWCHNVRSLIPLNVARDGNCLLHAVSMAVWGISDKNMMLRSLLCLALGVDQDHRFRGRWLHHRQREITQYVDKLFETGSEIMDKEWSDIRQCLEPDRFKAVAVSRHSLEPIHIYTLANILRRPVIVYDSTGRRHGGLSLQDGDMGGIYLPLEWSWMDTCRVPVLLGHAQGHFSPLLFADHPNQLLMEASPGKDLAPLVYSLFEQLPVRFLLQGEEPEVGNLLRKYLKVRETVMQLNERVQNILCAEVEANALPEELNLVTDYVKDCKLRFQQEAKFSAQHQLLYSSSKAPQVVKLECLTLSSPGQPTVLPPNVRREQLQGAHPPEYGLGDPTLHPTAGAGHQIHIPPPSFPLGGSFAEQSVSLNRAPEQKCKVPGCKFFGDPDLGMMCSSCFRNYTIRESRHLATSGLQPLPSAPLASIPAEEVQLQLSMMKEKCKENCGFQCSTKTFPYCHECANKRQKEIHAQAMAAAFETATALGDRQQPSAQSGSSLGSQKLPEAGEVGGKVAVTMVTSAQGTPSSYQPAAGGTPSGVAKADPLPEKTLTLAGAQALEEMTRALVTGDLPSPQPGAEDPEAEQLFGSGETPADPSSHSGHLASAAAAESQAAVSPAVVDPASAVAQDPAEQESGGGEQSVPQTPSPAVKEEQHQLSSQVSGQDMSSAASLAKSQRNAADPTGPGGAAAGCTNEGCREPALHNSLCGKCYVGQNMPSEELASVSQQMKGVEHVSLMEQKFQMSILSTPSSAPASIGPAASIPKSNATYTKEADDLSHPERRSQHSSLKDLRHIPHMNYTHSWIQENRFPEPQGTVNILTQSGRRSPPQGLPEKPESEPLGNDLIASGAGCFSSTQRCIGEGCGNAVLQAGRLCQQCQDILRLARQSQTATASGQAVWQKCRTERCQFYGIQENLGYCSRCYRKHFERALLEERRRHASLANSDQGVVIALPPQPSPTISVPPEFHYVRTPSKHQGQLCSAAGCRLFGDPNHAGMCFPHYQQHLSSIAKATGNVPSSRHRHNITGLSYPSEVYITPSSVTVFTPGEVFPPRQVSVSPPPVVTAGTAGLREPSLGETYYRVAGRYTGNCLNPTCSNYGNHSKGGLCNSCAHGQKVTDDLISRAIYGDEETG